MTDESGQSYPSTVNTLLDNALGARGYYGAFTANFHTDSDTTVENDRRWPPPRPATCRSCPRARC